jgi:anti-anti-sigma factor
LDAALLEENIAALIQLGKTSFAINLSQLDYLYSDTMNKFFAINRKVLDVNGRLSLLSPRDEVRTILEKSGIANFLKIYNSEEELLRSSQEIIKHTVSINTNDVKAMRPPVSEFEDFRSEIGNAISSNLTMQPPQAMHGHAVFEKMPPSPPMASPAPSQQSQQQTYRVPGVAPAYGPAPGQQSLRETRSSERPTTLMPTVAPQSRFENAPPPSSVPEKTISHRDFFEEETKQKRSPVGIVVAIIGLVILGGGGGAYYYITNKAPKIAPIPQAQVPAIPPAPVVEPVAVEEPVKAPTEQQAVATQPQTPPPPSVRQPQKPVATKKPVARPSRSAFTGGPTQAQIDAARARALEAASQEQSITDELAAEDAAANMRAAEQAAADRAAAEQAAADRAAEARAAAVAEAQAAVAEASPMVESSGSGGESGTIFIATIPPVAEVYLNGKLLGKSNVDELNVTAGTYMVKFVKGGKEVTKEMTFKAGKNPSQMIKIQ